MAKSSHAASSGWGFARSVSPRDPLGKTPSWSGSSGPFAASAWITPSFSMRRTFAGSCVPTSPTTTARVRIKRWRTTAPSHEQSSRLHTAGSTPFPRSAGSITATSASPDHCDRDPPVARSSGPAGCRRLCGDPSSRLRPPRLAALHISRSEDAASDPGRLNPTVKPPRHWRR